MAEQKEHWTIDKRVPLAVIFLVVLNFTGGIWFVASLDNRVDRLETSSIDVSRVVVVEERLNYIGTALRRIEGMVGTLVVNAAESR